MSRAAPRDRFPRRNLGQCAAHAKRQNRRCSKPAREVRLGLPLCVDHLTRPGPIDVELAADVELPEASVKEANRFEAVALLKRKIQKNKR